MAKPKDLSEVKFPGDTFLNIDDPKMDFDRAHDAALKRVHTYDTDPLLLGAGTIARRGKNLPV